MSDAIMKALVDNISPGAYTESTDQKLRSSRLGQLFVADWKKQLVLAGFAYRVTIGTITGGGDVSLVTGGGAGTTIDQDQPEGAIGVDAGYYLIPLEIDIACQVDLDADAEVGNIVVATDRAATVPTSVTGTVETPTNLLDGGAAFPGDAYSAITADITDPTVSEILAYKTVRASHAGTAASQNSVSLDLHYAPEAPTLLAGPCGLYIYWGGTAAVTGIASVVVAAIPEAAVKP